MVDKHDLIDLTNHLSQYKEVLRHAALTLDFEALQTIGRIRGDFASNANLIAFKQPAYSNINIPPPPTPPLHLERSFFHILTELSSTCSLGSRVEEIAICKSLCGLYSEPAYGDLHTEVCNRFAFRRQFARCRESPSFLYFLSEQQGRTWHQAHLALGHLFDRVRGARLELNSDVLSLDCIDLADSFGRTGIDLLRESALGVHALRMLREARVRFGLLPGERARTSFWGRERLSRIRCPVPTSVYNLRIFAHEIGHAIHIDTNSTCFLHELIVSESPEICEVPAFLAEAALFIQSKGMPNRTVTVSYLSDVARLIIKGVFVSQFELEVYATSEERDAQVVWEDLWLRSGPTFQAHLPRDLTRFVAGNAEVLIAPGYYPGYALAQMIALALCRKDVDAAAAVEWLSAHWSFQKMWTETVGESPSSAWMESVLNYAASGG